MIQFRLSTFFEIIYQTFPFSFTLYHEYFCISVFRDERVYYKYYFSYIIFYDLRGVHINYMTVQLYVQLIRNLLRRPLAPTYGDTGPTKWR